MKTLKKARSDRWMKRWKVKSFTDPSKEYTVAEDYDGNYGCDCPSWKFRRKYLTNGRCDHIRELLNELGRGDADTTMSQFTFEIIPT